MKCSLTPVTPIGKKLVSCISPAQIVEEDVYPPERVAEGKALREHRTMDLCLSMGEAARILDISVSDYSSIEHGRITTDLEEVRRVLKDGRDQVRASRIRGR